MKKFLIAALVLALVVGGLYYLPTSNRQAKADYIKVSDTQVQARRGGVYEVFGQLTNEDSKPHQVKLKILFYAKDNAVIGVEESQLQNIEANSTRPFRIFTSDEISSQVRHHIQISQIK